MLSKEKWQNTVIKSNLINSSLPLINFREEVTEDS